LHITDINRQSMDALQASADRYCRKFTVGLLLQAGTSCGRLVNVYRKSC